VLAIGGVTTAHVAEVSAAGAAGVAVIRAVLAAPDPGAATRAFNAALG
jgi:thiamine-phosphate pyrophosphorylase